MTVQFDMPEEVETLLLAQAQARGVPLSEFVRDFVVEHCREEADDLSVVEERLSDPRPGVTSSQMRENLGLDD